MPAEPRIDACIAAAPPFSRPILEHLRALVHSGCGEATEAIKWGRPFFLLDGRPLAMMAAFKAHAAFGFWGKGEGPAVPDGAGDYGRLTALADLPDDETLRMAIAAAAARVRAGVPVRPRAAPRPPPDLPADLAAALAAHAGAEERWRSFPPSHQRDYVEWVEEAKRADTRERRVAQAAERIARGESRNAKYERPPV